MKVSKFDNSSPCDGSTNAAHSCTFWQVNYTVDRFVDLHTCSHLRVLELDVSFGRAVLVKDDKDDLATICGILSNIPDLNQLHDVRFIVHVGYWVIQEPEALLEADWDSFCTQICRILRSKKSTVSLHMDYLPFDYTMIEGGTNDHNDDGDIGDASYYIRCENVVEKLVRDKFSTFNTGGALISVSTTYTISSFYS